MFCGYQDESRRLLIVFVGQIQLRQNKQNNPWLAVSLSHRRNGSVICFGGQDANGQMWPQLCRGVDGDTTHCGSQQQKQWWAKTTLILHPKPEGKQIAINTVGAALAFMFPEWTSPSRWFFHPNRYGRDVLTATLQQKGQSLVWPKANIPPWQRCFMTAQLHGSGSLLLFNTMT